MDFETWWQKVSKNLPSGYITDGLQEMAELAWDRSRKNQQQYQKYEFCQADACPYAAFSSGCPKKPEHCNRTAKEFHHWLQTNNYKIVKTE